MSLNRRSGIENAATTTCLGAAHDVHTTPALATHVLIAPALAIAASRARHPAHVPLNRRSGIENDANTTWLGAANAVRITLALATHAHIAPALATAAFRARYPAHVLLSRRCGVDELRTELLGIGVAKPVARHRGLLHVRSAGLMGDAAVYMTILYCLAFAPFLLPAANDVGALTATSYEVMRVLVITASLARLGGSGHVVLGSFQWSKVGETRGFISNLGPAWFERARSLS